MRRPLEAALCAFLLLFSVSLRAAEADARAVIEKRCLSCHGATRISGLDLRERDAVLRGGKRGPALMPGKPGESLLFRAVSGGAEIKMPPGRETLPAEEIETLRCWIESGALWSPPASTTDNSSWWSFRKPERPAVPAVDGAANPIDAFILRSLREHNLTAAPGPYGARIIQIGARVEF